MYDISKYFDFEKYINKMKVTYKIKDKDKLVYKYIYDSISFYNSLKKSSFSEDSKMVFRENLRKLFELSLYNDKGKLDFYTIFNIWNGNYEEEIFGWDLVYKNKITRSVGKNDLYLGSLHDKDMIIKIFNLNNTSDKLNYIEKLHNAILLIGWLQSMSFKDNFVLEQKEIIDEVLEIFNENYPEVKQVFGEINEKNVYSLYLLLFLQKKCSTNYRFDCFKFKINKRTLNECINNGNNYNIKSSKNIIKPLFKHVQSTDIKLRREVFIILGDLESKSYNSSFLLILNFIDEITNNSLKLYREEAMEFLIENEFINFKNIYNILNEFELNLTMFYWFGDNFLRKYYKAFSDIVKMFAKKKIKHKKSRLILIKIVSNYERELKYANLSDIDKYVKFRKFIEKDVTEFLEKEENSDIYKIYKTEELKLNLDSTTSLEE